jgi:competence protein ComEC
MWLGMLAIVLGQLTPTLAEPLNLVCAPLLGYLEWIAHAAARAPLATLPLRIGSPFGLAAAYASLAACAWLVHRVRRAVLRRLDARVVTVAVPSLAAGRVRAAVAAVALLLSIGLLGVAVARPRNAGPVARRELVVSFLDVGQGDATLLQQDGASVLVDTGPPGGPILRRLSEAGVGRLDLLVLTHAEIDHEGMALPVIRAHRPRLVLDGGAGWPSAVQRALPAALAHSGGRAIAAHAGQSLRIGRIRLRLLWPPPVPSGWRPDGNPNDRAIVALVQDAAFDLLLPADAESNVTSGLDLPRVEALKVAHHGSADEGLPALLERLAPDVAAIEVGARNTYGHPTASTLAALGSVPNVFRTDRDGTVRLHVRGRRMSVERHA